MTATPQTNTSIEEAAEELLKHETFAVCGHVNPDGDCIGSTLGLACALKEAGKKAFALTADDVAPDESFSFMEGFGSVVAASEFSQPVDVFVTVDGPNDERIGAAAAAVKARAGLTLTLDHHADPFRHSDLSYTDPDAASTTMIVWEVAKRLGIGREGEAARRVATCCYAGLLTDTGRFMHQNTDFAAMKAASEMVAAGASPSDVATSLFQQRTEASIRLDGVAAERMEVVGGGSAVVSWISLDDMKALGATSHDCENAIAPIRSLRGVNVSCLLKEREDGVRGSLRAKDDTDVSAIAREFGGGGHKAAAGFTLDCSLKEALSVVEHRLARL